MKKIALFIYLWFIWFIPALIEVDDSGEYFTGLTISFVSLGLTVLALSVMYQFISGWSLYVLIFGIALYLLIGFIFNEIIRREFGHRIFP